jgi:cyclic-di-GMP-binding protein
MTLDALRLEVPNIREEEATPLADLAQQLAHARLEPHDHALQRLLGLLFRLNRSAMTLLERQRALQSCSDEYRHYALAYAGDTSPCALFVRLCGELAIGFKRLLLQILHGRHPSRPHLAWCLYMAQHFLAQNLLRHYQLYQEPAPGLWRDSHLLYQIGEQQDCLDEPVAAAFQPPPAGTLRGLYQQMLLLALSDPFHLAEGECPRLFGALAPLARLARLLPLEGEDGDDGPTIDLSDAHADASRENLRRLELGALLVALDEPARVPGAAERQLLERARRHWMGQQQRRHPRTAHDSARNLLVGLPAIHAELLEQRPGGTPARMLDTSSGGARLLCNADQAAHLAVGQLVLLAGGATPTLALVRWRHLNGAGLHLGLRYLKGLPRPAWLRRAATTQPHPGVLQSTPAPGNGWHHGLWLANGQFGEGENLWLQLAGAKNQTVVPLPAANLCTASVSRHPLRLA